MKTHTSEKIRFIERLMQLERKVKKGYICNISSRGDTITFAIMNLGSIYPIVSADCNPKCYITEEAQLRSIAAIETRPEWQRYFKKSGVKRSTSA